MALTHTTSGFYQGYNLDELSEAILWELGQIIGTTPDYNRFPLSQIRKKLTTRQNKFVFHSHCLKKFALIVAKSGFRQYKLPVNCMDGGLIAVKYYDTPTSYEDLEIVDLDFMNSVEQGYLVGGDSAPQYVYQGDSYGNIPMMEVYPAPDADGVDYSVAPDTGVAIDEDLPGATGNITGAATGGAGDGTTLVDAGGVDFTTLGLVPGIYVRNVTDGSYAYILTIAADTITFAAALTGGTADKFVAGDSYNILAGEYGVLVNWEDNDRVIFGAEIGLLSTITMPEKNFRIDFVPYPMEFPAAGSGEQYPEIPKLYHNGLAMGVVADFLRSFHEKTKEFQRAEFYEKLFLADVVAATGIKENRPFKRKPVRIRPKVRRRRR